MKSLAVAFLFFCPYFFHSIDINEDISSALKTGNSKDLSKYFSETIDLKILDKEDIYSKQQAELILKDFFAKNIVKKYTLVHKSVSKNDTQYTIGSLETAKGKYRIYFLLKKSKEKMFIQQFRIEQENE